MQRLCPPRNSVPSDVWPTASRRVEGKNSFPNEGMNCLFSVESDIRFHYLMILKGKVLLKAVTDAITKHTKQRPKPQGLLRFDYYLDCYPTAPPGTVAPLETHVAPLISSAAPAPVPTDRNARPPPTIIADGALTDPPGQWHSPFSSHLQDTTAYPDHSLDTSTYTLLPDLDLYDLSFYSSLLPQSPAEGMNSQYMDGTSSSEFILAQTLQITDSTYRSFNANDNPTSASFSPNTSIGTSGPSWAVNGHFQDAVGASGGRSAHDRVAAAGPSQIPNDMPHVNYEAVMDSQVLYEQWSNINMF